MTTAIRQATRNSHITTEEVVEAMLEHAIRLDEEGKHRQAELVRQAIAKIEVEE